MDNALSFGFSDVESPSGYGTCNNRNAFAVPAVSGEFAVVGSFYNDGIAKRQSYWNFDLDGRMPNAPLPYSTLISENSVRQVWKSYIFNKTNVNLAAERDGVWQCAITAQIYLRHFSDFFDKSCLLKGCFFRLSIFVNQPVVTFSVAAAELVEFDAVVVNSPLGGVSPLMICSGFGPNGSSRLVEGDYTVSLAVGATCLSSAQSANRGVRASPLNKGVQLIVPSYTFNPIFESSYISSEVKHIEYCSQYNYNILNIPAGQSFTQNLTNGIANIKSLLFIPFYTAAANQGLLPIQSPFDPSGGGPTSPFCWLGNFNCQLSGANVLYNQGQYLYQQFLQQTQGVNAINAGLTDGLTSGLINKQDWEASYCYWYLDASRMLPVEEAVPKSVSITGQNLSQFPIDLYSFITYQVSIDVSVLSGARV